MAQTSATQRGSEQADAIRPFHMTFPEVELIELRRRINATKWPERETVADASQCVQLSTAQALARSLTNEFIAHRLDRDEGNYMTQLRRQL